MTKNKTKQNPKLLIPFEKGVALFASNVFCGLLMGSKIKVMSIVPWQSVVEIRS